MAGKTSLWIAATPRGLLLGGWGGIGCGALAAVALAFTSLGRWALVALGLGALASLVALARVRRASAREDADALARCPQRLPPVEPELAVGPPRPWVWSDPRPDTGREVILTTWPAGRAWVYDVTPMAYVPQDEDGGLHGDCTGVHFRYALRIAGRVVLGRGSLVAPGRLVPGDGDTDLDRWSREAIREGGSFTVLVHPGHLLGHTAYAQLEPTLGEGRAWSAT